MTLTQGQPAREVFEAQLARIRPDTLKLLRDIRRTLLLIAQADPAGRHADDAAELRRTGLYVAAVAKREEKQLRAILEAWADG